MQQLKPGDYVHWCTIPDMRGRVVSVREEGAVLVEWDKQQQVFERCEWLQLAKDNRPDRNDCDIPNPRTGMTPFGAAHELAKRDVTGGDLNEDAYRLLIDSEACFVLEGAATAKGEWGMDSSAAKTLRDWHLPTDRGLPSVQIPIVREALERWATELVYDGDPPTATGFRCLICNHEAADRVRAIPHDVTCPMSWLASCVSDVPRQATPHTL